MSFRQKLRAIMFGTGILCASFSSTSLANKATSYPQFASVLPAQGSSDTHLPRSDIERFVTTIALIHHYYISNEKNQKLFSEAIRGMVANLDPHSSYLDQESLKQLRTTVSGQFVGVGIELTVSRDGLIKVISPLDGSPAQKAGIKPDDLIIKIDDRLVRNMSLQQAVNHIKGEKGSTVVLTIVRKGENNPLIFNLKRNTIKLTSVKSKMLEPDYGYVRITFFQGSLEKQLRYAVNTLKKQAGGHLKGLVLDLRNNPGGLLSASADVANDFIDANEITRKKRYIVYTKGRIPGADIQLKAKPQDLIPHTPMVLLINGGTASASEIVAGALQDYKRAVIMGQRSFGKGSVQTVLPISKNDAIKLTTALYYTPTGREIQAQGITPDVTIPELAVSNANSGFTIDEADFSNHIINNKRDIAYKKHLAKREKILNSRIQLAKEDYQLYEALLMLKGMNVARNTH